MFTQPSYYLAFFLTWTSCFAQSQLTSINEESFNNFAKTYNYTFWDHIWSTDGVERSFTNHSSGYLLNVDFTNLSINKLLLPALNEPALNREEAFVQLKADIFPASGYKGDIDYAILKDGVRAYEKSGSPTSKGKADSQMSEFGTWFNRRFVSTNFTNSAPVKSFYTGVEFAAWHDRLKLTFHVRLTKEIKNGQLEFSITMPQGYSQIHQAGGVYGFADSNNRGFAIKGSENLESISLKGRTLTVRTTAANLAVNSQHEVSLILVPVQQNLSTSYQTAFQSESKISISSSQLLPNNLKNAGINYDATDGLYYLDIPRYGMGYGNCAEMDVMQDMVITLTNSEATEKKARLCFRQIPSVNVAGFNTLLRNLNGDPSGFPVQVSKNWHRDRSQLFSGSWIKEYTELIVPPNTSLTFKYTRTGAKWGKALAASSHQLSVAGSGHPREQWLEAALGCFGENITHNPDWGFAGSIGADLRPLQTGNKRCTFTANLGGVGMFVYQDSKSRMVRVSQPKTNFRRYSPNLTETAMSFLSADEKLKFDATFYLVRSDDFFRLYYKLKMKALKDADFTRFDLFQVGGDTYNTFTTRKVQYGNEEGRIADFNPKNDGSNDYTSNALPLKGRTPWLWLSKNDLTSSPPARLSVPANIGMIIRDYSAEFAGVRKDTPYFRERSSSIGFSASSKQNPTSYCVVPPPSVTSFKAGDEMSMLMEVILTPEKVNNYSGANQSFIKALTKHGSSWALLQREVVGNSVVASSVVNKVHNGFPITVEVINNSAAVTLRGGKNFVPIVFTGLTEVEDPRLWKRAKGEVAWRKVDQSLHGKDFWQADYDPLTGRYDLIYNVNQDTSDDSIAEIQYYLGDKAPVVPGLVPSDLKTAPNNR